MPTRTTIMYPVKVANKYDWYKHVNKKLIINAIKVKIPNILVLEESWIYYLEYFDNSFLFKVSYNPLGSNENRFILFGVSPT